MLPQLQPSLKQAPHRYCTLLVTNPASQGAKGDTRKLQGADECPHRGHLLVLWYPHHQPDVVDLRHTNMHTVGLIRLRKQSTVHNSTSHRWDKADSEEKDDGFRNESHRKLVSAVFRRTDRRCETLPCHPGLANSLKCFRLPSSLTETQL